MKRIFLITMFVCVSFVVFAQRTNNRGEYLVKSVHWVNALTQKEIGNKGDKWYHFKYDDNGNLIEVRKEFYQNFKYKAVETFTIINKRYQFISYINGKQVLNSKCEFTFNKQGYMTRLYIYGLNGERVTTVGVLTYYDNGELKSIDLSSEEKGGNQYKIHNHEEYIWENGNVVGFRHTDNDGYTQDFKTHYTDKKDNTNINLVSLTKHTAHPYNAHILFATEWCGKKPKKLVLRESGSNSFDYIYKDNLLIKINKKNSSYSKGYYLIEYVY